MDLIGGVRMKLMYISCGEMFLYENGKVRAVNSQRAEQYVRTLRQLEQKYAWKTEGEGAKFMQQSNPYANAAENARALVTGIVPHEDGIIYSIALSGAAGSMHTKYPFDPESPEGLVTSGAAFQPRDLHPAGGKLYFSLQEGGESHIACMDPGTGRYDTLTEGDALERHPFAMAGGSICFDMRGLALDENHRPIGVGPSAIAEMTPSGDIRELYVSEDSDYTKFTEAADGTQRMLVRPYKPVSAKANPLGCLLAPFYALAGFVHVFSSINAARKGKQPPLKQAGAESARPMEDKINIDGVSVDLKQLAREQKQHPDEFSGLVPRDWTLVSILPDGSLKTLQHGVLDYLPLNDGGYVYSNGRHVIHVSYDGQRSLLCKAQLATDLILLPENNA